MSFIVLPPFTAIYNAHVCLGNKAPLLFPNSFVVCVVCEVKEINFLGVILDENLNCKSEISHVASNNDNVYKFINTAKKTSCIRFFVNFEF